MINKQIQDRVLSISLVLALFFVLVILTDFYYKYSLLTNIELPKTLFYLKATIAIVLLLISLIQIKFSDYKKALFVFIAVIVCCVLSFLFSDINDIDRYLYILQQYFFGMIVFFFFLNYWKNIELKYLSKTLKTIVWLNLVLILIGFLFDFYLFKTYSFRFGYDGLFKSTSVATYFYMFSLLFFINQKKSLANILIFVSIIVSSLMVGSKSLYAFLLVIALYFIAKRGVFLMKNKKVYYGIFISAVTVLGALLVKPLFSLNTTLKNVLDEHGLITAIFSYRDVLVKNAIQQVDENFTIASYLFGGVFYIQKLTQVALVDLFVTFGIIGSLIFLYFLTINFPKIHNKNLKFVLVSIGVVILLRGNFFYYPSEIFISMTIFAMTLKTIELNSKNQIK